MDERYLSLLPNELLTIVETAEALAGCEVVIVANESAAEFDNLGLGLDQQTGNCDATISHRGNGLSQWALVHEVFHLGESWVDCVPFLAPNSEKYQHEAITLNDLVSHLDIIPNERRFVETESDAHWVAQTSTAVSALPLVHGQSTAEEQLAFFRNALQARALLDIALPHLDNSALYARLRDSGVFDLSGEFVLGLKNRAGNRLATISFVASTFKYPREGFSVIKFDLRVRPRRIVTAEAA